MDIYTYRRIWGTLKGHSSKKGYFPTPSIGFSSNNISSQVSKNYNSNSDLKKQLQTLLATQD